jgi:hypothetical protein
MYKQTVSNLLESNKVFDSKTYNDLSPLYKEAVNDVFKLIDDNTKDIVKEFEGVCDKVAEHHQINKQELMNYFERETIEQIG